MSNTFIWQRNKRNHTKTSCIKIIKLKRINNTREKLNGPSCFAEFPPLWFAEFPMLQATKATPPNVYEWRRDCPKTTPLWCFTHKVERRVICVLALTIQSLTINKIISAMEERKKTISPLPIDQFSCPRMSVRVFYFSPSCTQVGGSKGRWESERKGCKIRVLFALVVPNLSSPLTPSFSCLYVTLIRVNSCSRWPATFPTIRSQESNQKGNK